MVASVVVLMECMFLCIFVAFSNCVVDQGWYLVYVMTSMRVCVLQFYLARLRWASGKNKHIHQSKNKIIYSCSANNADCQKCLYIDVQHVYT